MRILVIGNGGREHAIIKSISKTPKVEKIYAISGNGGIASDAECENISVTDIPGIIKFAIVKKIGFAIVTYNDPLVLGCVDELNKAGIRCFGANKKCAKIEVSKIFSKSLMEKYNIPTAEYKSFDVMSEALKYIHTINTPIVIKADRFSLGKGVVIANTLLEAELAIRSIMEDKIFGVSGSSVVIEELLTGVEISVLAFTDGETLIPMVSSMNHKRALDGDRGANTKGMGAIAPNPYYTEKIAKECYENIFLPTINAMKKENMELSGCIHFGLMLTKEGVKVIEYNCRFGDPEAQVVLPLLESDLLEIMLAISEKKLNECQVKFSKKSSCCVVVVSRGYPQGYEKGYEINIPSELKSEVFVAGASLQGGRLISSGGRVLSVSFVSDTLESAIETAYGDVEKIEFSNGHWRKDIGSKAMEAKRV